MTKTSKNAPDANKDSRRDPSRDRDGLKATRRAARRNKAKIRRAEQG
jgi:hypothetical protein